MLCLVQVLLGAAAGTSQLHLQGPQGDFSASRSAPGNLNEPAAQGPSAMEVGCHAL